MLFRKNIIFLEQCPLEKGVQYSLSFTRIPFISKSGGTKCEQQQHRQYLHVRTQDGGIGWNKEYQSANSAIYSVLKGIQTRTEHPTSDTRSSFKEDLAEIRVPSSFPPQGGMEFHKAQGLHRDYEDLFTHQREQLTNIKFILPQICDERAPRGRH